MMENYRLNQAQDFGILRKKEGKEEELFVFGYSCKIYEDYEKSLYVDQGKHLIPWLGDESLKIDRYDCRGALHDLVPFLPKSEGFDRLVGLSNEEKRIESLCDQERFRALDVNEGEELLHQEEELKRLQKALNSDKSYAEVGFSYNDDHKLSERHMNETQEEENEEVEEEEPFIPPYQLDVPVGMKIPKSKKHHEIIEKTAFFINDQGAQMEILLKIKQADNPQFSFLSFDGELHPYYRHMMVAIKSGRYKSTISAPATKVVEQPPEPASEDTYLHPSLAPRITTLSLPESAPKIPNITYKPSVDCTYSVLVSRIKESQSANRDPILLDGLKKNDGTVPDLRYPLSRANADGESPASCSPTNSSEDGWKQSPSSVPYIHLTKSARRRRIRKAKNKAAVASFKIYYAEEQVPPDTDQKDEILETKTQPIQCDTTVTSNNDDLENTSQLLKPVPAPVPVLQIPPPDTQLIIDKMASYVAKNGRDFEEVVRSKGDARFSFLEKDHMYNPFYNQKVELYLQLENIGNIPSRPGSLLKNNKQECEHPIKRLGTRSTKSSRCSKAIPICFSIKKPKDQEALDIRSALPYEESEGENDEENEDNSERNAERNEEVNENFEMNTTEQITSPPSPRPSEKSENCENCPITKSSEINLEKWAQERLRAKLVTAAKEKLAAKEKDKQLQAERRKKAAEFINLLQKENFVNRAETPEDTNSIVNGKKDASDVITIPSGSSSDSDSVISVPLSASDEERSSLKRKSEHSDSSQKKEKRNTPNDYGKHRKLESDHHSSSRTRSPSHSRHTASRKYKKHDKEKKSPSKKKKHRHHQDKSPSHVKKSHKHLHKSKRSKSLNNGSGISDVSSYSSGSETNRRAL